LLFAFDKNYCACEGAIADSMAIQALSSARRNPVKSIEHFAEPSLNL
jgi:hypothetical protein